MQAKKLALALVLSAAMLPVYAQSQDAGWYGEFGLLGMSLRNDYSGGTSTVTPTLGRFVLGKELSNNLALEAMAGVTLAKAKTSTSKVSDTLTAIYVKPFTSLTDSTKLFGRIGYANNSGKSDRSTGSNFSWSSGKVSYGFGIQTQFTKEVYGAIDYMDYGKKTLDAPFQGDTIKHSGITLSVGMRF